MRIPVRLTVAVAVGAMLTALTASVSSADPRTVRVPNPANGHWYELLGDTVTWPVAEQRCEAIRAHLVTLTSAAENTFVVSTFGGHGWLGATDRRTEGTWQWVNGETFAFSAWAPHQPDDARHAQDFASYSRSVVGQWDDVSAPVRDHPLCEWDSPYVALGDSYSSGEGVGPFDSDPSNPALATCDRSANAWSRLLTWGRSYAAVPPVTLLACSGARINALTTSFKSQPPQLQQLAGVLAAADASLGGQVSTHPLVTITLGGNDIGFLDVLGACYVQDCTALVQQVENSALLPNSTVLATALAQAYTAIESVHPGLTLVVVGYPNIFPRTQSAVVGCDWLSTSEREAVVHATAALERTVRTAALAAHARYVSTADTLAGHEECTADSWMYPLGATGGSLRGHPTLPGQQAIAAKVGWFLNHLS